MALPPGIQPKTVTVGIASFFDGTLAEGTATVTAPVNVVHKPTNRPIFSSKISKRFVDGEVSFDLAPTDAVGLNRVDWVYKLNVVVQGALVQPEPIYFTLPATGPDIIDLDALVTVPSSAGTPVSVAVLTAEDLDGYAAQYIGDEDSQTRAALEGLELGDRITPEAVEANLPARLSEAGLGAAFGTRTGNKPVGQGEIVYNVKDYGAKGDGITDDAAAIDAAIAAIPTVANSFGQAPTLFFPAGRYLDSGSRSITNAKRFSVAGSGMYTTTVQRPAGAQGDWWTFSASFSGARGITFEGGRYQGTSGDCVVLDGGYTYLTDVSINKAAGNGLSIGKAGAAISHRLTNLNLRENAGCGIYVYASNGATDGQWTNIDVGNSGLYGVRLDTGAQNITNLHVWGSGLESTTDRDGVYVNSSSNTLTCWQSEKNLGRGVRLAAGGNRLVGGHAWGNTLGAVYGLGANNNAIVGNSFYRNCTSNTAGTTAVAFAVVLLESSSRNVISGNSVWDNSSALDANTYVTAPTYPYVGRTAIFTQALLFAETGTSDFNTYEGNNAPRELTRLGSTVSVLSLVGNSDVVGSNDFGSIPIPTRSVSSSTVRIPAESDTVIVSASQEITSVLGHRPGRVARIIFTNVAPAPVRDNGTTLNLNGDFTPTTNDVLSLVSDGTNWYEIARSAN